MKRILLFLILCLSLSIVCNAQTRRTGGKTTHPRTTRSTAIKAGPPTANGKFEFTKNGFVNTSDGKDYVIITANGKSAASIKSSVISSLSELYKNPNKVISTLGDNLINVTGHSKDVFTVPFGDNNLYYSFTYNISIEIKNGKIKVNAPTFSNITEREVFNGESLRIDLIDSEDLYFELSRALAREQSDVADIFNIHITKIVEGLSTSDW